ncbi:MAG: hypothetical protein E6G92_00270 [Alphaproteobacteria bacterium]|nr:MAG: hypothetical protein E6G92_00270 [Alphaproteobacteria bacterium]
MPGTGSAYGIFTLETSGAASVAFSADQTRIYVSKYDGKVDVFDAASHAKLATWNVGTSLGALTLSEDGGFLLAVERFGPPSTPGGGYTPPPASQSSTFYRIDTGSGAVTTFTRAGNAYLDIEIVDGQKAILTGGQQQVTVFDLVNQTYSTLPGGVYYSNSSVMVEDRHLTLFAESGISNGPLAIYDDRTGTVVAHGDDYQTGGPNGGSVGFNYGHQAISEAGGLVAQFIYHSTINLYDLNLHFIRGMTIDGPVDGLAFDPTGKFLYARLDSGQLNKIEVATGLVVDSFAVGTTDWHNNPGSGDQIVQSADGKTLLIHDNSTGKLQLIDLTVRDERFEGTGAADAFAGGKGDDVYVVNHAGDTITELKYDGNDTALASIDYTLPDYVENLILAGTALNGAGNALDNQIIGNAADNQLAGLAGNDVLDGGAGRDTMSGGRGDDIFLVDRSDDRVFELTAQGRDVVYTQADYVLAEGQEIEVLAASSRAGTAPLQLVGNAFTNEIYGNDGANYIDGGAGPDYLAGYGGNDVYIAENEGDVVMEAVGGGRDVVYAGSSLSLAAGSEVEVLSALSQAGTSALQLTGNGFANEIYANEGANFIDGGAGADYLVGFSGNDTYVVDNGNDVTVEGLGAGRDTVIALANYTLTAGMEIEVLSAQSQAAATALQLTGNGFANEIYANAGGNFLDGGGGADYLVGFGGNDVYIVDNAGDRVVEGTGGGRDVVYARASYTLNAGAEVEVLSVISQGGGTIIDLTGNELGQELYGNTESNFLDGGGGADYLQGFGGNDNYVVETQGDVVIEGAGEGNHDVVYARSSYALGAGQQIEVLSAQSQGATGALDLTGNEFGNELYGNEGANVLNGGAGGDYLVGYGGADAFAFTTALGGGNVDQIADFLSGTDTIQLDDAVFTGLTPGALNANAFVTGTAAQDADDRIVYDSATGALYFDADGNGAGAAVQFATLLGHPPIAAGDFTMI